MAHFLGIDIGTGESKGVLIDEGCNIVCTASCAHGTDNPRPTWFEHDAEEVWWGDFCKLSRELIDVSGIDPVDIGCVGLSALGCDCVPVDEEGRAPSPRRSCTGSTRGASPRSTSSSRCTGRSASAR